MLQVVIRGHCGQLECVIQFMNEKEIVMIKIQVNIDGMAIITYDECYQIGYNKEPFEFQGQFYRAVDFAGSSWEACSDCPMDSLCHKELSSLCAFIETMCAKPITLRLLNQRDYEL